VCDLFRKEVKHNDGTDKLARHLQADHYGIYSNHVTKKAKADVTAADSLTGWIQQGKRSTQLEAFVKWSIMTYQPLNTCDDPYFRAFCDSLCPGTKVYSREKIRKEVQIQAAEAKFRISQLVSGEYIALTTDHWTSVANESYLALTAHWIDANWVLNYRTITD
jgi:hypothetical protein